MSPAPAGSAARPWLPMAVGLALRLVNLQAPILGVHSWRQADTAAIARNFHEQGLVLWLPRVDWGGAGSGLAETDFPLYSYAVALLYRLLGVQEWLARGLSVLAGVLTIWLVARIGGRLLGPAAGWWGALFYALLPIPVFYGRTVQPEATLMLLAAVCLDRALAWRRTGRRMDLLLSWLGFCGSLLLKILPLIWLGLPLLLIARQRWGGTLLRRPTAWLYAGTAVLATAAWYWHAHQLGQASGLSFGFWGAEADRYSWGDLLSLSYWGDLVLRMAVRNFALLGVPLLIAGLLAPAGRGGRPLLVAGMVSVLAAGALAPESSAVHEYYQLPLMLYAAPLLGLGWGQVRPWLAQRCGAWMPPAYLTLLLLTSLVILSVDYWRLESPARQPVWHTAQAVRQHTRPGERIVAVTGSDPTLLYLSDRRGWLTRPERITPDRLTEWREAGADHLAGSWEVVESFAAMDPDRRRRLRQRICPTGEETAPEPTGFGCGEGARSFVIPLAEEPPR